MEPLRFEPDDLYPVVITIINVIEATFVAWSMEFAIKYCYPDLEGLVDPNNWDEETVEL